MSVDDVTIQTAIAGVPVHLTFGHLPEESKAFVAEYGLRQYLQDGAAVSKLWASGARKGEAKTDQEIADEKAAGVEERVTNLTTGTFTRRGTAERLSPEEKERVAICEAAIRAAATTAKVDIPTKKANADWWKEKAAKYYAKYQADVDKEVARRMKVKPVDMSDIFEM